MQRTAEEETKKVDAGASSTLHRGRVEWVIVKLLCHFEYRYIFKSFKHVEDAGPEFSWSCYLSNSESS